MPNTLDNDAPIKFPGGDHDRLLERLQGNIVKGHGRKFTVNIFLHFNKGANAHMVRQEITRLATEYVTSAARQLREADEYRKFGLPGRLFGNLFLSKRTYEKLDVQPHELLKWFADPATEGEERLPLTTNFVTGMKGAAEDLRDVIKNPTEPLETAYVNEQIDALLLLADNSEDHLLRTARHEVDRIHDRGIATVVAVEHGAALRNAQGDGIEHFGYVDGRSQPLFLDTDFAGLDNGKFVKGQTKELVAGERGDIEYWNPFAKLKLALLPDPCVNDPDAYGSYYVFRKLEQNVRGFVLAEADFAKALGFDEEERARAGAMAVGRFRDGTPLLLSKVDGLRPRLANDFRYDGRDAEGAEPPDAPTDRFGLKCPFQSHIRKVAPRHHGVATDVLERRIVRRGITYGERASLDLSKIESLPTKGVGLLFACFQRSIMQQFAFIQERWSSETVFPIAGPPERHFGLDAVIGQTTGSPGMRPWRPQYGGKIEEPVSLSNLKVTETHPTRFAFNGFVTFRGGEFFFAPSLPFLLNK